MNTTHTETTVGPETFTKVAQKLIPFLFLCYVVAFLDRVNVGFAKLQMAPELQFSDAVFGFGAGIFFIGYFIFEVPSNVILEKVGARAWIARIMISWGIISSAFFYVDKFVWGSLSASFNCTDPEFSFYVLRFLLGVAEAGFFPGIILYLPPTFSLHVNDICRRGYNSISVLIITNSLTLFFHRCVCKVSHQSILTLTPHGATWLVVIPQNTGCFQSPHPSM